jgi:hypothetical protein
MVCPPATSEAGYKVLVYIGLETNKQISVVVVVIFLEGSSIYTAEHIIFLPTIGCNIGGFGNKSPDGRCERLLRSWRAKEVIDI